METVTDREQNQCMYYKPTVIPKKNFLKFIFTCGCNQDKTVTIMQRHIQWMSSNILVYVIHTKQLQTTDKTQCLNM